MHPPVILHQVRLRCRDRFVLVIRDSSYRRQHSEPFGHVFALHGGSPCFHWFSLYSLLRMVKKLQGPWIRSVIGFSVCGA